MSTTLHPAKVMGVVQRSVLFALIMLAANPCSAVVTAKFYWVDGYAQASWVALGNVAGVDPGGKHFDVDITTVLKGQLDHKRMRIAVNQDRIPQRIAVGGPAAVLNAVSVILIHAGDEFMLGNMGTDKPVITAAALSADQAKTYRTSFPSRTPLFVQLLEDLSKGLHLHEREADLQDKEATGFSASYVRKFRRGPIVNDLGHQGLGGTRKLLDLPVKAPWFFWGAGDFNNVGRPRNAQTTPVPVHLLVGTKTGVNLFGSSAPCKDLTQKFGLEGAKPCRACAVGDLDGDRKADLLLLGNVLYRMSAGVWGEPVALALPKGEISAAGFGDCNQDGKVDVAVLMQDGTLVTFLNDGSPVGGWRSSSRRLWEDAVPPARAVFSDWFSGTGELCVMVVRKGDVTRYSCGPKPSPADNLLWLTGMEPATWDCYFKRSAKGPGIRDNEVIDAVVFDFNGWQCQPDLFVVTREDSGVVGGVFLGYRRYGAFMTNPRIIETLQNGLTKATFVIEPGTLIQAGRGRGQGTRQHLYYLKPNGELWQQNNSGG